MFKVPSFCVITGASRGLGREIALQIAREWNNEGVSCDMVITARSVEDLEETKRLITNSAPGVSVHIVAGDIGDMDALPSLCLKLFESVDTCRHKLGLLVNNAGTSDYFDIPFVSRTPGLIQDYLGLNVTSMMVLTTSFLKAFPQPGRRYIVSITTLLRKVFIPRFSLYSISRAARHAFMGTLKAEAPDVRQFSYSPGPCDTNMFRSLPKDSEAVVGVTPLTSEQSIKKLISLLKENQFENGCVIDYYNGLEDH